MQINVDVPESVGELKLVCVRMHANYERECPVCNGPITITVQPGWNGGTEGLQAGNLDVCLACELDAARKRSRF
jgi:hypothetical protein